MQRIVFDKDERNKLVAASLVLAFIFSIKSVPNFWAWVATFIGMFVLSAISLVINVVAHKYTAVKAGARAKFDLWVIRRFGFSSRAEIKHKPTDPLRRLLFNISTFFTNAWIVLPLAIAFFSNGQITFAAVGITVVSTSAAYRLGHKFGKAKEIELAKICLAGPIANILFALIIKSAFGLSGIAGTLVLINISIALSSMFPFYRLDGGKIFFQSLLLYIFGATFIIGASYLIYFLTVSSTLLLSITAAALIVTLFYYFHVFK